MSARHEVEPRMLRHEGMGRDVPGCWVQVDEGTSVMQGQVDVECRHGWMHGCGWTLGCSLGWMTMQKEMNANRRDATGM